MKFIIGVSCCILIVLQLAACGKTLSFDGDALDEDKFSLPPQPTQAPNVTTPAPTNTTTTSPTTPSTNTTTSSTTPSSTSTSSTTPSSTTPSSTTSSSTTPSSTTSSSTTPHSTTTTSSTTPIPTSSSTSTTSPPSSSTSTTVKPPKSTTHAPPIPPSPQRHFDGPSFIGGIVLAVGTMSIGLVAWKFYKARTERNYHTLSNLGDSTVI